MRKLILSAALLALLVTGCKKARVAVNAPPRGQPQPEPVAVNDQPLVHPAGFVVPPKQGGGGGGAADAVKKAVKRIANQNDLAQLRIYIETAALDQMPTREQLWASLQRDARNLHKMWADGVIEVPANLRADGVWAYTVDAQDQAGQHLVVARAGIERVSADELDRRVKGQ